MNHSLYLLGWVEGIRLGYGVSLPLIVGEFSDAQRISLTRQIRPFSTTLDLCSSDILLVLYCTSY